MKQVDRLDLSMMTLEKFKDTIDSEIKSLDKKAVKTNATLKAFLNVMLRQVAFEDTDDKYVASIERLTIKEAENWNKELAEKEKELHNLIKDYTYAILSYGELTTEDSKVLEVLIDKLDDYFIRVKDNDFSTYGVSGVKDLIERIKFFGNQIKEFRCWDSSYNINMFAESLILTGKHIRDKGNTVNHVKQGRKCMAAGGMLKKAYSHNMDHALSNYYEGSCSTFNKLDDGSRLYGWNIEYQTANQERLEKMMKIASKRNQVNEIQRQVDAWRS